MMEMADTAEPRAMTTTRKRTLNLQTKPPQPLGATEETNTDDGRCVREVNAEFEGASLSTGDEQVETDSQLLFLVATIDCRIERVQ
jgi:hypothetical protein